MNQKTDLSGEEISALMSGLDKEPGGGRESGSPRPFSFGGDASRSMSALPVLDRMNERMVRRLREIIEPFSRAKPRVVAEPSSVRAFGDWQAEQSEFISLSLYGFILFHELNRVPASEGLARLAHLVATGHLKPRISVEAPWTELGPLAERLTNRDFPGKAVLHLP